MQYNPHIIQTSPNGNRYQVFGVEIRSIITDYVYIKYLDDDSRFRLTITKGKVVDKYRLPII